MLTLFVQIGTLLKSNDVDLYTELLVAYKE